MSPSQTAMQRNLSVELTAEQEARMRLGEQRICHHKTKLDSTLRDGETVYSHCGRSADLRILMHRVVVDGERTTAVRATPILMCQSHGRCSWEQTRLRHSHETMQITIEAL